jgi:hypothetical protein
MHFMYGYCDANDKSYIKEISALVSRSQEIEQICVCISTLQPVLVYCNVQNKEEVFGAVHVNPSASSHWVIYETDLSQSAVWCALHA